jgi:hypothetical protein
MAPKCRKKTVGKSPVAPNRQGGISTFIKGETDVEFWHKGGIKKPKPTIRGG